MHQPVRAHTAFDTMAEPAEHNGNVRHSDSEQGNAENTQGASMFLVSNGIVAVRPAHPARSLMRCRVPWQPDRCGVDTRTHFHTHIHCRT